MRSSFLALILLSLCVLACKQGRPKDSSEQSITVKGSPAGKWLATLTIGAGVEAKYARLLSDTLRGVFLKEDGGHYTSAFHLSDTSGWIPNKKNINEHFAHLRE
jgi:hypothetical protein